MWTLLSTTFQNDPWQQVGIGALIAAPAYGAVLMLWRDLSSTRKWEREMLERITPLLAETVGVIEQAQRKSEQQRETDLEHALQKVERLAQRLEDR